MGNCFVRHRSGKKKLKTRSLYSFCTNINQSGTYSETISGIKYDIECVTVPEVTDDNVDTIFSSVSSNEGYFLLLKTKHINITKTLTPPYPKKSLIIFCKNIEGTGAISMTGKGPNTLPEDILLFEEGEVKKTGKVLIPAYANNATRKITTGNANVSSNYYINRKGTNGTNYNCGSGGCGGVTHSNVNYDRANVTMISGSGYSYGGGAGSGGYGSWGSTATLQVNTTYPMRGGNAFVGDYGGIGGMGNPLGSNNRVSIPTSTIGVGGRLIIFTNNCTIYNLYSKGCFYPTVDGDSMGIGGSSGGGSINIFYKTQMISNTDVTSSPSICWASRETGRINTVFSGGAGGDGTIIKVKCNPLM